MTASQRSRWVRPAIAVLLVLLAGFLTLGGRFLVLSVPLDRPDGVVSLASHEWERLPEAARLASANPKAVVLLTLPQTVTFRNCHDCPNRPRRLEQLGVVRSRVHVVSLLAEGTFGEALAVRDFAVSHRLKRVLVVTSPYHTRRTVAVFRKAFTGVEVQVGVQPASQYSEARPALWWMSPYDRWYVAYEWAAQAYYLFHYGVTPAFG